MNEHTIRKMQEFGWQARLLKLSECAYIALLYFHMQKTIVYPIAYMRQVLLAAGLSMHRSPNPGYLFSSLHTHLRSAVHDHG
jgi:hypothetical protein